jgi:hypothetical protein
MVGLTVSFDWQMQRTRLSEKTDVSLAGYRRAVNRMGFRESPRGSKPVVFLESENMVGLTRIARETNDGFYMSKVWTCWGIGDNVQWWQCWVRGGPGGEINLKILWLEMCERAPVAGYDPAAWETASWIVRCPYIPFGPDAIRTSTADHMWCT